MTVNPCLKSKKGFKALMLSRDDELTATPWTLSFKFGLLFPKIVECYRYLLFVFFRGPKKVLPEVVSGFCSNSKLSKFSISPNDPSGFSVSFPPKDLTQPSRIPPPARPGNNGSAKKVELKKTESYLHVSIYSYTINCKL